MFVQVEMNRLVVRKLKVPLTLPGNSPNNPFTRSHFIWRNRQQKRRHELIPYNDCLYRSLLVVLVDELFFFAVYSFLLYDSNGNFRTVRGDCLQLFLGILTLITIF